jgi:hypothetical protein
MPPPATTGGGFFIGRDMATAFTSDSMQEMIEWMDRVQREDAPWAYGEAPAELPRQPVRGKGGKPTGEYLPTGREAIKQMELQMGRAMTPKGANPKKAGTELPTRPDHNEELRRQQQASADAIMGPLDAVASAMERKWGVGRLQTLVSEEWALKFHSAATKLDLAMATLDLNQIRERAEIMRRGWLKLDEMATAAGHEPWAMADVWEVQAPNGTIYAIVRGDVDQRNAERKDGVATYTLAEVAKILQAWDEDGQVSILKAQFPDARVVQAGFTKPATIDKVDDPSYGI